MNQILNSIGSMDGVYLTKMALMVNYFYVPAWL